MRVNQCAGPGCRILGVAGAGSISNFDGRGFAVMLKIENLLPKGGCRKEVSTCVPRGSHAILRQRFALSHRCSALSGGLIGHSPSHSDAIHDAAKPVNQRNRRRPQAVWASQSANRAVAPIFRP